MSYHNSIDHPKAYYTETARKIEQKNDIHLN